MGDPGTGVVGAEEFKLRVELRRASLNGVDMGGSDIDPVLDEDAMEASDEFRCGCCDC